MAFGCALPFSHMIAPRRPAPAWRRGIEVVAAWTWPLLFIRSSRRAAWDGLAVQLQPSHSFITNCSADRQAVPPVALHLPSLRPLALASRPSVAPGQNLMVPP